jgi:DNA-binding CsgD family transcriptional regulator
VHRSGLHPVGRDEQLDALVDLVDGHAALPGTVVLVGEAGIGKTTLWLAGRDTAAERGFRVLSTRPSEAEARFSFGGLSDLLRDVADAVLPELPAVQRRALEAALLLGEPDVRADDRAVAAAFLGTLRLLVRDGPVCLAVDDAQWLDAASLAALRYALARLDEEPVAGLLAVRGDLPIWVRRAVPEARLRVVEVGALSIGAMRELLRARHDATFARPTLVRIWETSGGNPFFALELAEALLRRGGSVALGEELPLPATVDGLLQQRLEGLSADALQTARVVAALADPTVTLIESVVGEQFATGLTEAKAASVVEFDGEHVRFTHPLLRSAVVVSQLPPERRVLHARLAEIVSTTEERAGHLAIATMEPNNEVAATIEVAARSAWDRGAPAAAAELAEQALRLTPSDEPVDAQRRLFLAATTHDVAGDTVRAVALLEHARDKAPVGAERAVVLVQLADVQDDPRQSIPLYLQALDEAGDDPALSATIHTRLASLMAWGEGAEQGIVHAELAVQAASQVRDIEIRCRALATQGEWRFRAGRGLQRALMDEAVALERSLPGWPFDGGPTDSLVRQLVWSLELERARQVLRELIDAHRVRNDADGEATSIWWLALLEWRAGNWEEAETYAEESHEIRAQLGLVMPTDLFPVAVVAAHQGRIEDARAAAHDELAGGEDMGIRISQSGASWVLGFVDLSLGDATAALVHLRRAYDMRNAFMLEPGQRIELGDLLEALIAADELDEADSVLATWEARAGALDRAWALAILARCRALLHAARGDLEGSFVQFDRALSEHARATDPFHQARTLLALGRTQRRAKRRAAARATLGDALARFERLGAPLWAEQTRVELARIGGRAPSTGELTEAEQRIAGLVAEGRTNREVAAALFLTEHSVETALTRVYRKLGVRSRAELTRLIAANR